MKITITTSPKGFETANYLLAQAIHQLSDSPEKQSALDVSESDVQKADKFRKSMVKAFLASAKTEGK